MYVYVYVCMYVYVYICVFMYVCSTYSVGGMLLSPLGGSFYPTILLSFYPIFLLSYCLFIPQFFLCLFTSLSYAHIIIFVFLPHSLKIYAIHSYALTLLSFIHILYIYM
jgi:hypothetical protein